MCEKTKSTIDPEAVKVKKKATRLANQCEMKERKKNQKTLDAKCVLKKKTKKAGSFTRGHLDGTTLLD